MEHIDIYRDNVKAIQNELNRKRKKRHLFYLNMPSTKADKALCIVDSEIERKRDKNDDHWPMVNVRPCLGNDT